MLPSTKLSSWDTAALSDGRQHTWQPGYRRACDSCHVRRRKCDGLTHCQTCKSFGMAARQCYYLPRQFPSRPTEQPADRPALAPRQIEEQRREPHFTEPSLSTSGDDHLGQDDCSAVGSNTEPAFHASSSSTTVVSPPTSTDGAYANTTDQSAHRWPCDPAQPASPCLVVDGVVWRPHAGGKLISTVAGVTTIMDERGNLTRQTEDGSSSWS